MTWLHASVCRWSWGCRGGDWSQMRLCSNDGFLGHWNVIAYQVKYEPFLDGTAARCLSRGTPVGGLAFHGGTSLLVSTNLGNIDAMLRGTPFL